MQSSKPGVAIALFQEAHQSGIDALMQRISLEFEEPFFSDQSQKIATLATLPNHCFWVATHGLQVIGTIGMVKLAQGNIVLKSMFVDQTHRG